MRFAEQYVDPRLEWPAARLAEWSPHALATEELAQIREEVQVVLAAITNPDRPTSTTDRRQLSQALAHLRKMRALWAAVLIPGTVLPTGENKLPSWTKVQSRVFTVRDWTFSRERRAVERRAQYVTVARQIPAHKDRMANRLATYYNTDVAGVLEIAGRTEEPRTRR